MCREIKFRVWDTILEKMLTMKELEQQGMNLYALCEGLNIMKLMQSTGIKDKNGTEIYEGDIVKKEYKTINGTPGVCYSDVYKEKTGAWRIKYPNGTSDNIFHIRKKLEVVGNVYEDTMLESGLLNV